MTNKEETSECPVALSPKKVELYDKLFTIENNWQNVLYIHTPFCLQKCYYCVYSSKVPKSKDEMDDFYHRHLPAQLEQYKNILENVTFDQLYFGGGTPSIADAETLAGVYKQIPGFKDIPMKTTESSPYTITDEHVDLYHENNFRYVSMGVQTLSKRVLKEQNRLVASEDKLTHLCRRFDEYDMVSNIDLIFYLDKGGPEDLELTRSDLETVMSVIRPVSITLHSNYRVPKSQENRQAMIRLIREMTEKYPEYRCTNAQLQDSDTEYDMVNSAEYRLMRKQQDFNFYMLPKIPQSHTYGHNMIAVGEFGDIKPRDNYYYLFDNVDKYIMKQFYRKLESINTDFEAIRDQLGLKHHNFTAGGNFFKDETGKEKFRALLKQTKYPYYQL